MPAINSAWSVIATLGMRCRPVSFVRSCCAPDITPLPNASYILKGISHVSNEFITITEPLLRSSDRHEPNDEKSDAQSRQLLVVAGPDGPWGMLVDDVAELTNLDDFQPRQSAEQHISYLGTATHLGNDVRVLDVDETYRSVASDLKTNWQHGVRNIELAQEA